MDTKTIIAAVITAVAAMLALGGHKMDEQTQSKLVESIADIANGVSVIGTMVMAYLHARAQAKADAQVNAANTIATVAINAAATANATAQPVADNVKT